MSIAAPLSPAEIDVERADVAGSTSERRASRLLDGAANARATAARLIDGERLLFLLGAFFVSMGFLLIMIGWFGAGDTGLVFEQVPYIISGGLGGLGFMVVGSALYVSWWMTRLYRQNQIHQDEARARHEQTMATQQAIVDELRELRKATPPRRRRALTAIDEGPR